MRRQCCYGHSWLIAFAIACIANGGAREGIIHFKTEAFGIADELMPSCFFYLRNVVILMMHWVFGLEIPDFIGVV
jgi:hypothetical protein